MTRVLYLDCYSGASGDMLLGACLDAGLPLDTLRDAIGGLGLADVELSATRVRRSGIEATKFTVVDRSAAGDSAGAAGHRHRHLPQILRLIEASNLSAAGKTRASELFRRLAVAEAAVHGIPVERVHFHEVGAIDSIVDIVGAVFAFEWFNADDVVASALNTGSGTVRCAHGVMPVPAPATARLVAGAPVYAEGPAVELLTPTGALLVTGYASRYGPLPAMTIERVGYGAGERDFPDRANVVRLVVGQASAATSLEQAVVVECEVDDLNPQVLGVVMTRLFDAGARDVYFTAVQMKKGRPGTLVTAIVQPLRRDAILDVLFAETTTLGVRMHEVVREVLDREMVTVNTPYGPLPVKVARRHGRVLNAAPEFDECARVAEARGLAVKEVLAAAIHAWRTESAHAAGAGADA